MSLEVRKKRGIFDPKSTEPFKLSRSKIDLFLDCPQCFFFDRKLGIGRPPGFPFNLNSAVDCLLKKEFDAFRREKKPHPLMTREKIDAIPFEHPHLEEWRTNFTGVQYHHTDLNFILFGAVDDVWVDRNNSLIVVDYKSTSKDEAVTLDDEWKDGYKRQAEVYQWLLRNNGFSVSDTAYFVYANGRKDMPTFQGRLEFRMSVLPYVGSDKWIEPVLYKIKDLLMGDVIPQSHPDCEYCAYRNAIVEDTRGYNQPNIFS